MSTACVLIHCAVLDLDWETLVAMDAARGLSQGRSRDARAEARAARVVWRRPDSLTGIWRPPTIERLEDEKDETVDSV